ncbi:MFS transporter [Erythrobacter sp. 3-20A1M]|uniref:MFS transporter n=1 Tax=Erythrobacter sp. 3-20A1M TaxID=2653850 RepID=UPI001BFC11BC|nr:MFS transporter [Erythrobacter sp. 3-20A1M]
MAARLAPLDAANNAAPTSRGWLLALTSAATLLSLVIFTVPLTTVTATADALGAGPGAQAWILSAMPLGAATGLLATGTLGDQHGRRLVFLIGLVVCALSSAVAALSVEPLLLIAMRVVQGLGAAALMSCGLGLLGHHFARGREQTHATSIWAACLGAGVAIGPIMAAYGTRGFDWSAAYWATTLLSTALLLPSLFLLPRDTPQTGQRTDWLGTALLMAGLALVMAGLTDMRQGLGQPLVWVLLVGGAVALALLVRVERSRADPLIDFALFREASFVGATVAAFASGAGILALMSLVPVILARGLGVGIIASAFILTAWSATSVIAALAARALPEHWEPRWIIVAAILACALAQALLYAPAQGPMLLRFLPALFLAGAANGLLNSALGQQAVATVPDGKSGAGSGANNTARYLGSAIGITVSAILIAHGGEVGGIDGLIAGWNEAVIATVLFSLLGAGAVACAR